ncbi:unnamed protein product [Rodentolepis nana]|uniref:Coiled-coil domain-containing protein 40 n=1 Tax=Rodentolepis nana TaxID=102285 RepID=A0A0R3T2M4_RODNA|nr:unnamed protein product [Rodentolepis nana]
MSQFDCISSDAEDNIENVHYISDKDLGFDADNYINNFENETAEASENVNEIVDESLTDNAEDNSNGLVVLHPDHPLMKRFQDALQKMLKEHLSKAELELKEKSEDLKRSKTIHLELGSELYNAQQELSKFQGQLQKKREEHIECQAKREKMDELLVTLRQQFKKTQEEYDIECKKMTKMREEVDNLALRLFYLNNAKLEVKSDISIMKRAAEKVTTELTKAEEVKLHQDMIAHRMQRTVDQLMEDVELLKEQVIAAEEELRSGEVVLKNMESQVMGIKADRKRLMSHWTTSLIGLQRRNEAYAELMQDFQKKQDELTLVNAETEGIKKDITKEQEKHERLTLQLHRTQGDIVASQRELERLKTRHDEIRAEYAQTQRIIEETERNLENANTVGSLY